MTRIAFHLVLLAGLCQAAFAAKLSGTVTDSLGNALEGAEVSLVLSDRRTTTDAQGAWTLEWSTTGISERPSFRSASRWTGSTVDVTLSSLSSVKIEAYSLNGSLVGCAKTVTLEAGLHRIPMSVPVSAGTWLRITINGRTEALYAGLGSSIETGGKRQNLAARVNDFSDTLQFAWNGVVVFKQFVSSLLMPNILTIIDSAWKDIKPYGIPWNKAIKYGALTYHGQTYRTVKIGAQIWMAENLNYRPETSDTGSYYYPNNVDSAKKYGRLYTWATLMGLNDSCNAKMCANQTQPKHQGICPTGWHVPNNDEWDRLITQVGGKDYAGYRLKSTAGWITGPGVGGGTDEYGFRALPTGFVSPAYGVGKNSDMWSATEYNASLGWHRGMYYYDVYVLGPADHKSYGFSARCIED